MGKRPNIKAALEQAEEAANSSNSKKKCVAICKWDRESPIATMRLEDFIELLSCAIKGGYDGGLETRLHREEDGG